MNTDDKENKNKPVDAGRQILALNRLCFVKIGNLHKSRFLTIFIKFR